MENINYSIVLTILFAAAVTYGLRVGGLLLSEKLPQTGAVKRFMDALPGTILLSLIAPAILHSGTWGGVAASATALCAYKTRNVFLSMILGMTIIVIHRNLI